MAHSRDQQTVQEQVFEGVKDLASFRGHVMSDLSPLLFMTVSIGGGRGNRL